MNPASKKGKSYTYDRHATEADRSETAPEMHPTTGGPIRKPRYATVVTVLKAPLVRDPSRCDPTGRTMSARLPQRRYPTERTRQGPSDRGCYRGSNQADRCYNPAEAEDARVRVTFTDRVRRHPPGDHGRGKQPGSKTANSGAHAERSFQMQGAPRLHRALHYERERAQSSEEQEDLVKSQRSTPSRRQVKSDPSIEESRCGHDHKNAHQHRRPIGASPARNTNRDARH
jgi:hypothetical protein